MAEHLHLNPLKCRTVSQFMPHFYKSHGERSREADMKGMQAIAFLQRASEFFELTARHVPRQVCGNPGTNKDLSTVVPGLPHVFLHT